MRPHTLLASALLTVLSTSAACSAVSPADPQGEPELARTSSALSTLTEVTGFGTNPGALKMFVHAPAGLAKGSPAVLVLHGCMQGANDAAATGWNDLADELGFLAVYPEQAIGNNSLRCFNWAGEYGDPTNLVRGKGENQSLKEMVDKAVAVHGVDPKRVFVVGFSAGAAEAAVAAATWPDVFAGAAILAGIPFNCTTTYAEVSGCQKPGKDRTPAQWGTLVKNAFKGYAGPYPRVSVWQGSADTIVGTANRMELVEQWTDVHGVAGAAAVTDTVDGQAHQAWKDASGNVVVETYEIAGMAHAVPIASGGAKCGTPGAYAIDKGICAPRHIATFFGLDGAGSAAGDGGAGEGGKSSGGPLSSSSSTGGAAGASSSGGASSGAAGADGDASASAGATCAASPVALGALGSSQAAVGGALGLVLALASARRARRATTTGAAARAGKDASR